MSFHVVNPYQLFKDSTGVPRAGGFVTFFVNTTTTVASIYSDDALTIAQNNPYPLDAYGCITGDVKYSGLMTLQVTNSDGSDVITTDNVTTTETSDLLRQDLASTASGKGASLLGNAIQIVNTLAILKGLTGTTSRDIWCRGRTSNNDGYEGLFGWDASDLSTEVTADTTNALYVPPDSDNTGASGAWIRDGFDSNAYNMKWFGAITGTDDTVVMQAGLDSGADSLFLPSGSYKPLTPLSVTTSMELFGEPGAIIDGADATFVGTDVIKFEGAGLTQIAELNANVSKGDSSFTFASSITLVAGDIFVIANPTNSSWSGFNVNYKAGEYCEVLSVVGNTVKLKNPLYDDYVVADVDVYKQDSITPIIRDIEINGDVSDYVINLKYCKDARVINVTSTHQNEATLSESHCYATEIHRPTWNNYGDGGNDYGWLTYSSQHSRMFGGNVYSRRHAVTMGGGVGTGIVPSRDIKAIGSVLKNDVASVVHNFDWHGHAEDCQAVDCTIYGGATWQGKNNGYVNCDIYSSSEGWCILSAGILGGKHYARGCRFKTEIDPNAVSRGVIDVAGNSNAVTSDTAEDATFIAEGCSLESASLSTSTNLVTIRNRGTTQKLNVNIDNFTLDVNAYGNILFMDLVSGTAASDFVRVENINSNVSYDSKIVDIRDDYDAGNYQVLTGAGAVDLTHKVTHIDTTGGAAALTLADSYEDHEKFLVMSVDVGAGTLTPSNLGNGTDITFDDVGDSAHLIFTNGAWHMVGGTATLA